METTTTNFENAQDAMDWISKKYLFNEDVYPVMKKLTTDREIECFIAKHCLLHIQKSISVVAKKVNLHYSKFDDRQELCTALAKILVNLFTISHHVGVEGTEFEKLNPDKITIYEPSFFEDFLISVGKIAAFYEKIDHGESMGSTGDELHHTIFLTLIIQKTICKTGFKEFLNFLPSVMKSK